MRTLTTNIAMSHSHDENDEIQTSTPTPTSAIADVSEEARAGKMKEVRAGEGILMTATKTP
jgi:hypothetical protein